MFKPLRVRHLVGIGFLCASCSAFAADEFSAVAGIVRFTGTIPTRTFADNDGRHRPLFEVSRRNSGLPQAVVFLQAAVSAPSSTELPLPARISQVDGEFVPRVVAVRAGQVVSISNEEPANHNVRSVTTTVENLFNVMTPAEGKYEHAIKREREGRPIQLLCDIHPWMVGWIYVFEHDLFTVTDEDGGFRIPNVPAGVYRVVVQQPDGGLIAEGDLSVKATNEVQIAIDFTESHLARKSHGKIVVESSATETPKREESAGAPKQ